MNEQRNCRLQSFTLLIFIEHLPRIHWGPCGRVQPADADRGQFTTVQSSWQSWCSTGRGGNLPADLFTVTHPQSSPVSLRGHAQYFSSSWTQLGLCPHVLNLMIWEGFCVSHKRKCDKKGNWWFILALADIQSRKSIFSVIFLETAHWPQPCLSVLDRRKLNCCGGTDLNQLVVS